jgi:predicted alpha/beta hydrolase family esterase
MRLQINTDAVPMVEVRDADGNLVEVGLVVLLVDGQTAHVSGVMSPADAAGEPLLDVQVAWVPRAEAEHWQRRAEHAEGLLAGHRLDGWLLSTVKVAITDPEPFRNMRAATVRAYLVAHGWQRTASAGYAEVWQQNEPELRILLPDREGLADHVQRMADAVNRISEVEGRSQLLILRDLLRMGEEGDGA